MASNKIELDAPDLMKRVTLHVKLRRWRQVRFRLWLMRQVLVLAAIVGGVGIEFEEK